jgi:hypothetical protein
LEFQLTGLFKVIRPEPPEKELLETFSKLSPETQEFILEMARNLLKRQKKAR